MDWDDNPWRIFVPVRHSVNSIRSMCIGFKSFAEHLFRRRMETRCQSQACGWDCEVRLTNVGGVRAPPLPLFLRLFQAADELLGPRLADAHQRRREVLAVDDVLRRTIEAVGHVVFFALR